MKLQRRKKKLIQITQNEKTDFRIKWYKQQNGICPILKKKVSFDKVALDHKHKRKNDPVGPNGDGLCRGVIQMQANALEGKIINNFKRLGLEKHIDICSFLRNLADYLEHPPIPQIYIHPDEEKKPLKIKKNWFNKLNKLYQKKYPKRKALVYPKSEKMTKHLKTLCYKFNLPPQYKKR